jgi:uncharacterized protein (DUF885 family)
MSTADEQVGLALAAIADVWEEFRSSSFAGNPDGPVDRLPDVSEQGAIAISARATELLEAIDSLRVNELPHELALTVESARNLLSARVHAADWYWLVFDPLGVGFYSMYAPTAYSGGWLLSTLSQAFTSFAFEEPGDYDRYLGLVEDLARLVRQLDARTRGQAERGIHIPRPQLETAVPLMTSLRAAAATVLVPDETRVADADWRARVQERVDGSVLVAYDELIAWLSHPDRLAAAGEDVGLGRLPGGAEVYAELVRMHTTLDITPEEVHQRGLTRVHEIRTEMQAILDELGATHAPQEHMRVLAEDPAWRAEGAEAIAAVFQRYMDRIRPHIDSVFRFQPEADYGVEALSDALSGSMTFGYYAPPSPEEPLGRYFFNARNLSEQPLANIPPLTYHELVPGHHFHMASQRENEALHPLRRNAAVNAFSEGWAEYAAHVAGELGMYAEPNERFGKLVMEAFLTTRLVVDTGMNVLGWTLEQAREFMRENAFVSEAEVLSESVRYSCGIPAQALGYKIGDLFFQDLRATMQKELGEKYDVRDFHDAVLRPGCLPLRVVEANVQRAIAALKQ